MDLRKLLLLYKRKHINRTSETQIKEKKNNLAVHEKSDTFRKRRIIVKLSIAQFFLSLSSYL